MAKLLIMGDSNVAMFKTLFDEAPHLFASYDVTFWFATGMRFVATSFVEGHIVNPDSNHPEPLELAQFDKILYVGGRLQMHTLFSSMLSPQKNREEGQGEPSFSLAFIRAQVRAAIKNRPGNRVLRGLREHFSGDICVIPSPLRTRTPHDKGIANVTSRVRRVYDAIWSELEAYLGDMQIEIVRTPDDMLVDGFLISEDYLLDPTDRIHKPASYARRLWSEGCSFA